MNETSDVGALLERLPEITETLLRQTAMVGWLQIGLALTIGLAAGLGSRWAWKKWDDVDALFLLVILNLFFAIVVVALLCCGVYAVAFTELSLADTLTP